MKTTTKNNPLNNGSVKQIFIKKKKIITGTLRVFI